MMAINFCNPAFGTTVVCSSVSADSYEPQNLLQPGLFGQWKGFLAEHFIKPPLNITFTIPFKIDLCSIIVDPTVGSQRSCGIEIFSASVSEEKNSTGAGRTTDKVPQIEREQGEINVISTNIGKAYCNDMSPRLIQFVNRRYRALYKVPTMAPSYPEGTTDVLTRDIRSPRPVCIRSVNQVVVRITRVQGGSVPALKRVAIWGQPASSCGKPLIQKILGTVEQLQGLGMRQAKPSTSKMKRTSHSETNVRSKSDSKEGASKLVSSHSRQNSTGECPEEFLDPITCHIMVIPILLPSGHTVDQETLERHNRIEATWGRPPNDPFTGVPFSSVGKPIANAKLKSRLDKFLLMNGTTFKDVPRTAESNSDKSSLPNIMSSVLVHPNPASKRPEVLLRQNVRNVVMLGSGTIDSERQQRKRQRSELERSAHNPEQHNRRVSKKSKVYGVSVPPVDLSLHKKSDHGTERDPDSHEKAVSESLDDALALTLASLPSYKRKTSTAKTDTSSGALGDLCVNCQTAFQGSSVNIYKLPCEHLMCRECTVPKMLEIMCNQCKRSFKTSDLSRVHKR